MAEEELYVLLNETMMGTLFRSSQGKLRFCYDKAYLHCSLQIPLSLSMPLLEEEHTHDRVLPFLWGLLPDNDLLLQRWAARFHVSASNPFAMLSIMGEDCAGAIRFIKKERFKKNSYGGKKLLSTAQIEKRLLALASDPSLTRTAEDQGQFSLAGAQTKTALQKIGSRWFLPWGNEPTTHILKLPRPDLAGHIENEYFCLQLATQLGLATTQSEILHFGKTKVISIKRYDRIEHQKKMLRLHQEDICQALSIPPTKKYENMGGPGISAIMNLLNQSSHSQEDRHRFIQAIIFNYLILGSDAHAKNYSLLLGHHGNVRLAPLYDIASLLPYVKQPREQRLSMRIDRSYRDDQIHLHHFEKMARQCEYPYSQLEETLKSFCQMIPKFSTDLTISLKKNGLKHPILETLSEKINQRCKTISKKFFKS